MKLVMREAIKKIQSNLWWTYPMVFYKAGYCQLLREAIFLVVWRNTFQITRPIRDQIEEQL